MCWLFFYIVGADYNAVSETLLFNAGRSRVCFFTSAVGDDRFEDEEIYLLTLTSDEPGLTLNPDVATVTIPDDDREYIPLLLIAKINVTDISLYFRRHYCWFD